MVEPWGHFVMNKLQSQVPELSSMTWVQVRDLPPEDCVALLPVGAVEAHGPHLPLITDVIIAKGMAQSAGQQLRDLGQRCVLLEPLAYTAAPFARAFPGTISLRPETLAVLLEDLIAQVLEQGFAQLVLCNAHLDPTHVGVLRRVCKEAQARYPDRLHFPDVTRRRYAAWLTPEFQSGACHAGQYESSIVLAQTPDLVREPVMRGLSDNMHSLVDAMRAGKDDFVESGGPEAYFGSPSQASAQEGQVSLQRLGQIVVHALTGQTPSDIPDELT